jgi:hypothetical protein
MPYKDKDKEREYKRKQQARRRAEDPERFREVLRKSYAKHREQRLADSKQWRTETPERSRASYLVSGAKKRAKSKGLKFDLTFEWALEKIQHGFCEATGIALQSSTPHSSGERNPWVPSIDRIDPSLGYVQSNCRVVVWIYNAAKSEFTDDDVRQMAVAIATAMKR